jgi:hypothetical protein
MKATEVFRQYAEGRRDFRKENLRGLSFNYLVNYFLDAVSNIIFSKKLDLARIIK